MPKTVPKPRRRPNPFDDIVKGAGPLERKIAQDEITSKLQQYYHYRKKNKKMQRSFIRGTAFRDL